MSSLELSAPASRPATTRRRWVSAGLRSAALLVVPLAAWLAIPAPPPPLPPAPPPRPAAVHEDEAPPPPPEPTVHREPRPRPVAVVASASAPAPAEESAPPSSGIAGIVVDEQGQPVMEYIIGVDSFRPSGAAGADGGAGGAHRSRIEDPEGKFVLSDLAPGRYDLVVSVPLGSMARSGSIDVTAGAMTRGVRIVVGQGVTVTGTVTDAATHAPLDGARAFVLWGGMSTRQPRTRGGAFTLENAPAGRFDLRVTAIGYAMKIVRGLEGRPGGPPLHVDVALEREPVP